MSAALNRRVVLARRPAGALAREDFAVVEAPMPEPASGGLLVRNLYLSIDPYLRGRMDAGAGYAPPFPLGEPPAGTTLAEVVASDDPRFPVGQRVVATGGWQRFTAVDAADARVVPDDLPHPTWALGPLGTTGFAAWYGTTRIGEPRPGETVVVSAASGAVGSVAGQIARLRGARVVGIAGAEKCRHVVDDLGFDACVDRDAPDVAERLAAATGDGIDVYFENVGGRVFDAVWPRLNQGARVAVCGVIAGYDGRADAGTTRWSAVAMGLVTRRIRVEGFMTGDHAAAEWNAFAGEIRGWLAAGAVRVGEDVTDGLDRAPDALIRVLAGRNRGKSLVRV